MLELAAAYDDGPSLNFKLGRTARWIDSMASGTSYIRAMHGDSASIHVLRSTHWTIGSAPNRMTHSPTTHFRIRARGLSLFGIPRHDFDDWHSDGKG